MQDLIHKAAQIMEWKCVPTGNTSHVEDSEKWVNEKGEDIIEGRSMLDQVWNPLELWDDCMQLVDKLREKGYTVDIMMLPNFGAVTVMKGKEIIKVPYGEGFDLQDPKLAILTAATKI